MMPPIIQLTFLEPQWGHSLTDINIHLKTVIKHCCHEEFLLNLLLQWSSDHNESTPLHGEGWSWQDQYCSCNSNRSRSTRIQDADHLHRSCPQPWRCTADRSRLQGNTDLREALCAGNQRS